MKVVVDAPDVMEHLLEDIVFRDLSRVFLFQMLVVMLGGEQLDEPELVDRHVCQGFRVAQPAENEEVGWEF